MKKLMIVLLFLVLTPLSVVADDDIYPEADPYVYQSNFGRGENSMVKEFAFSKNFATPAKKTVSAKDVNALLMFNGSFMKEDMPIIADSRALIPVRVISENLGYQVQWNEKAKEVTISKGDKQVQLVIGQKKAIVNNVATNLEVAASITKGKTYVPLRFLSEAFDLEVGYDTEVIDFPIVWVFERKGNAAVRVTEQEAYSEVIEELKEQVLEKNVDYKNIIEKDYTIQKSGSKFGRFWCITAKPKQFGNMVYYLVDKYSDEIYVGCYFGILDEDNMATVFIAN